MGLIVHKYITEGSKKNAARLFLVVSSDRERGNGHKLKYRKIH